MKMLFSSSDGTVYLVRQKLLDTGIPCEIRDEPVEFDGTEVPSYPELWVEHEKDFKSATEILTRKEVES